MNTNHTPGNWQRCTGSFGPYIVAQTDGKDTVVAKLHHSMTPDVSEDESIANAKLIAAAPELLAALEAIAVHHIEQHDTDANALLVMLRNCRSLARAAIAKANCSAALRDWQAEARDKAARIEADADRRAKAVRMEADPWEADRIAKRISGLQNDSDETCAG